MTVGLWHRGGDSPGMPSLEALSITREKPQNWVTSEDMGLTPKDKEVPVHPPRPLNLSPHSISEQDAEARMVPAFGDSSLGWDAAHLILQTDFSPC